MTCRSLILCCLLPAAIGVAADSICRAAAAEPPVFKAQEIRGANYVPSYASTSVGTWLEFQAGTVDRELAFAQHLKLNSVRVFLQYVAHAEDPAQFRKHLEQFVAIAARHQIRPMFVLFDSCFGKEPSIADADSATWVNNPGYSRIADDDWSGLETYVADIVSAYANDPRILMWDIMNEPMADFEHVTRAERDRIWKFCRHFCQFVKARDERHPITVGHAVVEYIPRTADLVDVFSIHSYSRFDDWLQHDIDVAQRYGRKFQKPVIFTEFGNPGAGQNYEMALDVIERNRLGFYFWELMIGKVMFKDMSGLVYPDGTVRDLGPVARLLHEPLDASTDVSRPVAGFRRKVTGGIPLKQPPDATYLRTFLARSDQWKTFIDQAASAQRTRANINASVPPLAMLGRHLYRPAPEAQEVFELALSIPHHFRLGREQQGVAEFERLLLLVKRAVAARQAESDRADEN